MRENVYFYFVHTHVLFISSLVFLWFNTTTATSFVRHHVSAAGGADNTCIDKERQALLDFKALQDPYDMLSRWRPEEEDDCCQWDGVTCDIQTGHVTKLKLHYCGLGGEISLSLLNLTYLNHLDLYGNWIYGTIPKSIGNMTQLTYLNLGDNQFTGSIPQSIGSLTELTELWLSRNNFSGIIPKSIGSLTKLTDLYLSDNSFYGTIPTEFGNLTNLLTLSLNSLRSCRVENLDWLSSLSYLEDLYMDGISLAKANNWVNVIIGLPNLWHLSLVGCDLSHVMHPYSSSVNSSSSMYSLYLNNNNLSSSMFRWLCPLVGNKIAHLLLSDNKFDGKLSDFLNNLSGCTSVTTLDDLDTSCNQFTGSVSDVIQNFSSLTYLNLSSNQLDGTISDKLWQLTTLKKLDLSSNSLRGAISEHIGKSNLRYIDLSYNSLEVAPFNDGVSNFSKNLDYVDFSSNKLGPCFPKWIQKLEGVIHLDLSNNSISDTISTDYWNLLQYLELSYLDLSLNNISGTLPKSLSNHNLDLIDLSFNCFYGPIPAAFPSRIKFLDLSRNKFHGGITFLSQLYKNLEFLDLSHNSLTKQLPDYFQNLIYLKVLNLGHNILSGRIPPSIGYLGQLETLCLYNNSFSGELPLSLKNCTKLSLLDLGANKLYGNIPVWIGQNLSMLYALSLNSNNFFGAIPSQICQLVSLQILDLSYNNLNGTIPSCVNNLTSMVQKGFFVQKNVHHYHSRIEPSHISYYIDNPDDNYIDRLLIKWQGKVNEFSSTMGLVKAIDLSSNNLTGQIPSEITNLHGLLALDLSNNSLVGEIPRDIGQMAELLTLNLSRNMFSGKIPSSLSEMHSLNDLDVSFNNLSGRVPSSTQLQSFPPEWFTGNTELCGLPTWKTCLRDEDLGVPHVVKSESDELQRWFYVGGATGFATGFWIVCSALLLNRRGRHAFFHFHDSVKDWVYVTVVVFIAKWRRVARA